MREIVFIFYFHPNKIEYAQNKTHEFQVLKSKVVRDHWSFCHPGTCLEHFFFE